MDEFILKLDNSSKKFDCPACGKRRFVRYVNTEKGEYLPEIYGRCDREINCGYFLNPYKDGYKSDDNTTFENYNCKLNNNRVVKSPANCTSEEISYIPYDTFKQSLSAYHKNNFVLFLLTLFDKDTINNLIHRYHLGTSNHWSGAVVFWQVDKNEKVRSGKVMLYDQVSGRRIKEPFSHITWAHKVLNVADYNLQQCFFGEHLLISDAVTPVALVESEKTAVIASAYLPGFIWLAVGSLSNLSASKCSCLKDRKVILFPDLNCFNKWTAKANEISAQIPDIFFEVSNFLECQAPPADKTHGFDLADYLIRFDFRDFANSPVPPVSLQPNHKSVIQINRCEKSEKSDEKKTNFFQPVFIAPKNEFWNISELESFFENVTFPPHPFHLNPWTRIINPEQFVSTHLEIIRYNNGNQSFRPYFDRLIELKSVLISKL